MMVITAIVAPIALLLFFARLGCRTYSEYVDPCHTPIPL